MSNRKAFLLRINADLYKEIEAWAHQELRSVNGQIEFLLTEAASRRRGRDRHDEPAGKPPPKRQQ